MLLDFGVVEHVCENGFRYYPPKLAVWMVCDILEQPNRIAELAAQWHIRGRCVRTIFNLKLPMKKCYQQVRRCLARIDALLRAEGIAYALSGKQLDHDCEAVTLLIRSRMPNVGIVLALLIGCQSTQ